MDKINITNYYAAKYLTNNRSLCCFCQKVYCRNYKLKSIDKDEPLTIDNKEVAVCRNCMILKGVNTKIKCRCETCGSFYKLKCKKCIKDNKVKEYTIKKIYILLGKLQSEKDVNEVKQKISNFDILK
jgi:hypothetical protein